MAQDTARMTLADLQTLAEGGAADLPAAVLQLLSQDDPDTGPLPKGALDPSALRAELERAYAQGELEERRRAIALTWRRYLRQSEPPPAPRFLLADFLVSLYEKDDEPSRAALVELAGLAPLRAGPWGGLKRIFKRAEERHDALLFGALAARLDVEGGRPSTHGEVSKGTLVYLRRRAWRFLRHLGQALPELYPQFAAAVLARLAAEVDLSSSWVAGHILRGRAPHDAYGFFGRLPEELYSLRAFDDAWKAPPAADVLMGLLEQCRHDQVARFGIEGLKRDFPQRLRAVDARWLGRVARRQLPSLHDFVIDTLEASPELPAARLRELGLHDTVLSLLLSPSARARTWAIEYARAHAQDLPAERLVEYASGPHQDTQRWAASALARLSPRELGHVLLGRLLGTGLHDWAAATLEAGFDRAELPRPWMVDLLFGSSKQSAWALGYLGQKYGPNELDADFWKGVLGDPRAQDGRDVGFAFRALLALGPEAVGGPWVLDALAVPRWRAHLVDWLGKLEVLPGVDVERLKGLVFDPQLRPVALELLGRPRIAGVAALGLPWLLALTRRADPVLHQWASRYLLHHLSPGDFAGGDAAAGVERLLELATGPKEPDAVRAFGQAYLTCHHPVIGPEQPLAVSFQVQSQLTLEAYRPEPYWKALGDARADVRRFALTITRASLRPWGWHTRVYELADSEHKEVRLLAFDALLKAGQAGADPRCTLALDELDAASVFAMTESRVRATRELAMDLLTRHYDALGGAERLGWLMASADRTVRQMAVRMLWQRHRPRHLPAGFKPKGAPLAPLTEAGRFTDVEALREFLRALLFGLPPGRAPEPAESGTRTRRVAAGVAKQRAIEAARDLALDDESFARVLSPVLAEFTGSMARGEWQSCLSALVALQRAHPSLELGLTKGA